MTCDKCHQELHIGDFPYCPHGSWRVNIRGDEIPGGMEIENLGPEPQRFYSWSDYHRAVKAAGLEQIVRHVPLPGSDKSPHTTSWATMDPYTLEQGRILAERQAYTKATNDRSGELEHYESYIEEVPL